jgi:hypothetical protein
VVPFRSLFALRSHIEGRPMRLIRLLRDCHAICQPCFQPARSPFCIWIVLDRDGEIAKMRCDMTTSTPLTEDRCRVAVSSRERGKVLVHSLFYGYWAVPTRASKRSHEPCLAAWSVKSPLPFPSSSRTGPRALPSQAMARSSTPRNEAFHFPKSE